jgi:hypothetical protein
VRLPPSCAMNPCFARTQAGGRYASIALCTSVSLAREPSPVRHQVAPAAIQGAGSVPGGFVTTKSKFLVPLGPRSA